MHRTQSHNRLALQIFLTESKAQVYFDLTANCQKTFNDNLKVFCVSLVNMTLTLHTKKWYRQIYDDHCSVQFDRSAHLVHVHGIDALYFYAIRFICDFPCFLL